MRFGRRAGQGDDADVCIDLRERLAPYIADNVAAEVSDLEPTMTTLSPRERPLQAAAYKPRHLAR